MNKTENVTTAPEVQAASALREFGLMERFHLLMSLNHPNQFAVTIEVSGKATPEMWRNALDEVQRRHPLLNACIGRNERSRLVYQKTTSQKIPLTVKERTSSRQWEREVEREIATLFDISTPPLIRALLLQGSDRCEIILTTHHTVADGISLTYIVRDLMQAVSGEKLAVLPLVPAQEKLFADIAPNLPTPEPDGNPSPVTMSGKPLSYYRPTDGERSHVHSLRLSQEQTTLLVESARREGTTVHGALCAALVLVGREISPAWKERQVRVLSPLSIRKTLGLGEDSVLAISAGLLPFDPPPNTGLWELARWTKQSMLPFQTLNRDSMKTVEMLLANEDDAIASENLKLAVGYELAVSNLQRVPIHGKFGDLTVEAFWGPAALNGFEGEHLVGAATVNGSLCLVYTSYAPFHLFLERALQMLSEACKTV